MFDEMMRLVNACDVDVEFDTFHDGSHLITLQDFEGFDDDWSEIMRDYNNEKAVDALLDWLETHCISCQEKLYTTYTFPDFQVKVGYASFDI